MTLTTAAEEMAAEKNQLLKYRKHLIQIAMIFSNITVFTVF